MRLVVGLNRFMRNAWRETRVLIVLSYLVNFYAANVMPFA